jgi:hypothetical protein
MDTTEKHRHDNRCAVAAGHPDGGGPLRPIVERTARHAAIHIADGWPNLRPSGL